MSVVELSPIVSRLESVAAKLEKMAFNKNFNTEAAEPDLMAPFVSEYDQILSGPLSSFLGLSSGLGGDLGELGKFVEEAFKAQREFLLVASKSQEPTQATLISLLKPTSDQIQIIQEYRQKHRSSPLFNHLSAISEAIPALGWVTVSPAPSPFVKEMADAGQFYTNRVLMEHKDKNKTHVDWSKAWIQVLTDLQAYVKQFHITGLCWSPIGGTPVTGGPPPPPPPPPASLFQDGGAPSQDDSRAALFRDISKGEGVTKGLRKVTSEQQTHKNPNLRLQSTVSATAIKPVSPKPAVPAGKPQRLPLFELEGKKWKVENQMDNNQIVIDQTEMNQSVNVYQCQNSVISVKGKINSITVDSCKKTSIVFEDIVSFVEFINCRGMQAQSLGKVPTVTVDKSEGVLIYMSTNSLDCELVTSMSFEVNVAIPKADGDFAEHSIPEQFKSVWNGKCLKTEAIEKN